MKKITKTLLRKVLSNVTPDPKKPGPFRIIAGVGNIGYYDQRAIEAIRSGDRVLGLQLLVLAEAEILLQSGRDSGPVETGSSKDQGDEVNNKGQAEIPNLWGSNDNPPEPKGRKTY